MADYSCLAEGYVVPADMSKTGVNLNEIICGPTGCGKSMSNAYSRLCHTTDSSVVTTITKKAIRDKFAGMFKARGYKVVDIDFVHPDKSRMGYDPLDYVKSEEDVMKLARAVVMAGQVEGQSNKDPYWDNSAINVLAAEIFFVKIKASVKKTKPSFAEVIELHRKFSMNTKGECITTNLDPLFDKMEQSIPNNPASALWKSLLVLPPRTAGCIISTLSTAIDRMFTPGILTLMKNKNRVQFGKLGKEKTALFIMTSPMNKALQVFINIMYGDMFYELFNTAENNPADEGKLSVPVHIICEDFATGSRICDFEEYISIFRAAGISVTLLIQSESQLISMYGADAAVSIINNVDTYVYMGGMDITTASHIAQRVNKPVHKILSMPLERVIVFRRGTEPVEARRYQILEDPIYKALDEPYKDERRAS